MAETVIVNEQNPWPGLAAYTEVAGAFFCGRDDETMDLLSRVRHQAATVLFGKSGLGKTSLLQAGLFPKLRSARILPVYIRLDLRGDGRLIDQAAAALRREITAHIPEAAGIRAGETVWEYLHRSDYPLRRGTGEEITPLLVFDQFEEIFTLGRENRDSTCEFTTDLCDLVENHIPGALFKALEDETADPETLDLRSHRVKVLVSLREDFLPDLEALTLRSPSLGRNRMRLICMKGDAAMKVVAKAPVEIQQQVAEKVVRLVAGARDAHLPLTSLDVEPALLSLFCRELNLKRQVRAETGKESMFTEDLVEGSRDEILSGFYQRSIADRSPDVALFIEDRLVTVSGYRDSVATENALDAHVTNEDIDCLVDRRLIRREGHAGLERIELIHDCLLPIIVARREQRLKAKREKLPVPYDGDQPYIFASFSREDATAVEDVMKMAGYGFRLCYDEELYTGEEWNRRVAEGVRRCSQFVVFLSRHSRSSRRIADAAELALKHERSVLPVLVSADDSAKGDSNDIATRLTSCCAPIERYRLKEALDDYYDTLVKNIPAECRQCPEDMDYDLLGMGKLPTISDFVQGSLNLEEEVQEKRRQRLVDEVLKTLQETGRVTYSIDTVFQLTAEETGAEENLSQLPLGKVSEQQPTNLLSHPLQIDTAYLAPLRLVTGLITRLAENWPPLITAFTRLVGQGKRDRLSELHYFIEFCWLAWGPSVLTTALLDDDSADFMVAQAAFGDEANSLPLIMKKSKWREVVQSLKDYGGGGGRADAEMGWPVRLQNLLIVKPRQDTFFNGLWEHELLQGLFTRKTEDDPEKIALYLPSGDEGYPAGGVAPITAADEAFYSTAYVWLMLEQEEASGTELAPGRVIPFFEHANLATTKGLNFLLHCLARKAIYHVLQCEVDPDYREEGVYRFATALFPQQMVEILEIEKKRLAPNDRKTVERRLKISPDRAAWRSASEVVRFADAVSSQIMEVLKPSR